MVEALLKHAPVRVIIVPEVIDNPQKCLKDHNLEWLGNWLRQLPIQGIDRVLDSGLDANLQPAFTNIIMVDGNQPGHIFAHEAVHLLARASGVDPSTFLGNWELRLDTWPGEKWWKLFGEQEEIRQTQPGFSLQMEREAMIVEHTIRIEAPLPADDVPDLRSDLRILAGYDTNAAFEVVKKIGRGGYDWFPPGNEPPRYWRADLLALGLGPEVIRAIEDAAQFPPPPPSPR